MKSFCAHLCVVSLFVSSLLIGESAKSSPRKYNDGVFIVYLGAAAASRNDQTHMITSLVNRDALVHTYTYGILGFAARLKAEEARAIAQKPGVVSVFPDSALELHTTRSWDFLNTFSDLGISATRPASTSDYVTNRSSSSQYVSDTIIGILDSGIWPESASFNDYGMGPVPARWKGTCQDGYDFNSSLCNRKIIGARYYGKEAKASARDGAGHGTHVASTAAGSLVDGASYYGLAAGTARGGSPTSRIAMYKVCGEFGECYESDLLKAFDDAIKDGVDVLSLSLGLSWSGKKPNFLADVVAIGSFHAVEKGIIVVCSAGNSGPNPSSLRNEAPWIFTVAASTLDRHFESPVILGDGNTVIKGTGIHFGKLKKTPVYPLVTGVSAKLKNASVPLARACLPQSLDPAKVKGKIVVCEEYIPGDYEFARRADLVRAAGGKGLIEIVISEEIFRAPRYGNLSSSAVTGNETASKIFTYISSTKNPVATILPTVTTSGYKPAPAVIFFSSRGPALTSLNILKPDITAPGVDILAAWPDKDFDEPETPIPGMKPPSYNMISGTSMSCPHTSGTVAAVKAHNPTFSVSALRSAVMTTAIYTNNFNTPITNASGGTATPYEFGAGQINPTSALDPGLVYETEIADYLLFLCATGYNETQIRLISSTVPKHFKCPRDLSSDSISNINYPSIAISNLNECNPKTVTRTATNVGDEDSVYIATIEALREIGVVVTPTKLIFTKDVKKVSYNVTFTSVTSLEKDIFGSITWTNGKYTVRSPIVVSN